MPNYKLTLSKNQKKYSIVMKSDNLEDLKIKVHKDGYSILGIEEVDKLKVNGLKYYFKGLKDGTEKNGIIIGKDIFKAYFRLRKQFGYEVLEIYQQGDENLSKEEKEKVLRVLKDSYEIYNKNSNKKKNLTDNLNRKKVLVKEETNFDKFYLKKQLEELHSFILYVLKNIDNLLENKKINLSVDEELELKTYKNNILVLKKTTNIEKLKQIGEEALIKAGEIELKRLETEKDKYYKDLLKETNSLLKKVGSQKHFKEKTKDIKYYFSLLSDGIKEYINEKDEDEKISFVDKKSYSYLKSSLLLLKYKTRLKKNNFEIFKYIYYFLLPFLPRSDKFESVLIKRRVIKQNISLLKAKQKGKVFSYTKVKNSYNILSNFFRNIFLGIRVTLFRVIYFYIILFLIYLNLGFDINFNGLHYFIILFLVYLLMLLTRGFFTFFINIVILYFIIIFGIINF